MSDWKKYWQEQCNDFKNSCLAERQHFMQALNNPLKSQRTVLQDVLTQGANTEFGKAHNFTSIKKVRQFQQQIPIRTYDQLAPWINKEVEEKGGVLSFSPIERWLRTSGSTGNSKRIPYTKYWREKYRVPALQVLWANYINEVPDILDNPYATLDTQSIREPSSDFLNGIPYQGITNRNVLLGSNDWNPPWFEAPWFTADVPEGYDNRMYYRLRYFVGHDLRAIMSINPSTLGALYQSLLKNFDKLIQEVADGTINGVKCCEPNTALAKKLHVIHQQKEFTFKDLWPNLRMIACWTSSAAKLYLPQLNKLFPDVKILPFMTCGTEGIVTLPVDSHSVTGPLAINQGFYEFLPAEEDINAILEAEQGVEALLFNQLELGKEYHLIMTQASGMCRYAVGDIYKVTGFFQGVPRIEFSQRAGTNYSFTGEKLTEPQMLSMVQTAMNEFKLSGGLFMCCPVWDETPYYKVLLETDKPINNNIEKKITKFMDDYLCDTNEEYASKRKSHRLGSLQILLVKKGCIEKFQEIEKKQVNALQYKYKPFRKNDEAFEQVMSIAKQA